MFMMDEGWLFRSPLLEAAVGTAQVDQGRLRNASTLAAMDQIATPFCSAKSGLDLANFPRFDLHYRQEVS